MSVTDLTALARAYYDPTDDCPQILAIGMGLPSSQYDHPVNWNAVLPLGTYQGTPVKYYAPRSWSYEGKTYALQFGEEVTTEDSVYVEFKLSLVDPLLDRIIFLNTGNDDDSVPEGAEVFDGTDIR
jgi:hypothetical protein